MEATSINNNKERFQNSIKVIKHEIYKVCGFRATKSPYNNIIQESPSEGVRFTINKEYITQEEEYILSYL